MYLAVKETYHTIPFSVEKYDNIPVYSWSLFKVPDKKFPFWGEECEWFEVVKSEVYKSC